ncbi:alpha-N-acetylglucosaminidase-like [Zingiber officinale]|uniref:alpha-N-acetylglucosaminidase-like n=1 Tax=Zingiber officinale TaxID=94328 RepID=UPI001C4B523C|nr:alpha-N-acetylglucosaminidase-like [Zingiber officinale]
MAFPITASVSFLFLFLFLFFSYTTLSFPLVSSPLARLLDIQRREQSPPSVQLAAARGLLARLLPSHISSFDFEIVSKETCGREACFIISNHPSSESKEQLVLNFQLVFIGT